MTATNIQLPSINFVKKPWNACEQVLCEERKREKPETDFLTACLSFSVSAQSFPAGYQGKPDFLMPQTCLGHTLRHRLGRHYGMCEHLSPNHNLSQDDRQLACEVEQSSSQASQQLSAIKMCFVWTSSGRSAETTFDVTTWFSPTIPYFRDGMVENCANSICISRHCNLRTLVIHRRCAGDPLPGTDRQIAKRCHLQLVGDIWEPD